MRTASIEQLLVYSTALLTASGADKASTEAATWAVLHASAHGVDSHGIRLLPWYAECLRTGLVKGSPGFKVSQPRRAVAVVDADGGMGHIAMYRAMDEACALARDCGIGLSLVIKFIAFRCGRRLYAGCCRCGVYRPCHVELLCLCRAAWRLGADPWHQPGFACSAEPRR